MLTHPSVAGEVLGLHGGGGRVRPHRDPDQQALLALHPGLTIITIIININTIITVITIITIIPFLILILTPRWRTQWTQWEA